MRHCVKLLSIILVHHEDSMLLLKKSWGESIGHGLCTETFGLCPSYFSVCASLRKLCDKLHVYLSFSRARMEMTGRTTS